MKKTKPTGLTLVEVIIVMAISAILVVIAVSTNKSRGRRDFDNAMKQVYNNLKTIQNESLAGLGPDRSDNCINAASPAVPADLPGQKCPVGELFGSSALFGTPNKNLDNPPDEDLDFGSARASDGTELGRVYYSHRLAFYTHSAFEFQSYNYGPVTSYELPAGVGYRGSCKEADCTPAPSETIKNDVAALFVFAKVPQVGTSTENYGQSNAASALSQSSYVFYAPLTAGPFREPPAWYYWKSGTCISPCDTDNYAAPNNKQPMKLFFEDFSGQYHAIITLSPQNNELSLELK